MRGVLVARQCRRRVRRPSAGPDRDRGWAVARGPGLLDQVPTRRTSSCSGRNGCPGTGDRPRAGAAGPASTTSCSGLGRRVETADFRARPRSSNSADVSPPLERRRRAGGTAPRPSSDPQARLASSSGLVVPSSPTFSTTSPSVGALTTGATHALLRHPARTALRRPPTTSGQTGHDVREFGEPVAAVGGERGEPLRDGEAGRLRDHLSGSVTPTTCSAPATRTGGIATRVNQSLPLPRQRALGGTHLRLSCRTMSSGEWLNRKL